MGDTFFFLLKKIVVVHIGFMEIQAFTEDDLASLHRMKPADWDDITPSFKLYTSTHFCFPLKATVDKKVVGIGALILNGTTAWIAHIVVHPNHQRRGIGLEITEKLVVMARRKNCSTISLTATPKGQRIYRKLGFKIEETYILLNGPAIVSTVEDHRIQHLEKVKEIHNLDRYFSGEDRRELLAIKANPGLVYRNDQGDIQGYYLPKFGDGLVNALSTQAGFALLQRRCTKALNKIGLPKSNDAGVKFLLDHGFVESGTTPRMRLGNKLNYQSQFTFGRTGGDFG